MFIIILIFCIFGQSSIDTYKITNELNEYNYKFVIDKLMQKIPIKNNTLYDGVGGGGGGYEDGNHEGCVKNVNDCLNKNYFENIRIIELRHLLPLDVIVANCQNNCRKMINVPIWNFDADHIFENIIGDECRLKFQSIVKLLFITRFTIGVVEYMKLNNFPGKVLEEFTIMLYKYHSIFRYFLNNDNIEQYYLSPMQVYLSIKFFEFEDFVNDDDDYDDDNGIREITIKCLICRYIHTYVNII